MLELENTMSVQESNKQICRDYFKAFLARDTGWMAKHIAPDFVRHDPGLPFEVRGPQGVAQLHDALLPAFPGMHAIQEAFDWGVRITGVTVHIAEEAVDGGPPILQEPVPILADDTVDTLAERIHGVEHRLLTRCVTLYARGRIRRDPATPRRMIVNDDGGS